MWSDDIPDYGIKKTKENNSNYELVQKTIYLTVRARLRAHVVNASSTIIFNSLATNVNVTSMRRYVTSKINIAPHNALLFQKLFTTNNIDLDKMAQNVASHLRP